MLNTDADRQTLLKTVAFKLSSTAFVFSLYFITALSTFGQSYAYSDAWISDSMVPDGTIYEEGDVRAGPYIYGCGVTSMNYTSFGHQARTSTTITSPQNRTQSASAYGQTYARVDVALLWDPFDLGGYGINSTHWGTCSSTGGSSFPGSTYIGLTIGASRNAMRQVSPGSYGFAAIQPCSVRCYVGGYISRTNAFTYANLYVPFGPAGCLRGSIVTLADFPSTCQDFYVFF